MTQPDLVERAVLDALQGAPPRMSAARLQRRLPAFDRLAVRRALVRLLERGALRLEHLTYYVRTDADPVEPPPLRPSEPPPQAEAPPTPPKPPAPATSNTWERRLQAYEGRFDRERLQAIVDAFTERRGLPYSELAKHADVPSRRVPGVVAELQRLLNLDGEDVLRDDRSAKRVDFDADRFEALFGG